MALAAAVAAALLLILLAVPARLARAAWPAAAPAYALALWQALGLAGGLLALELLATVALAPEADSHLSALTALLTGGPHSVRWWSLLAGLLWLALLGRLLFVLARSTMRTLRSRRAHRELIDLVATRNPLLPRARVVDHDLPVAYCLPGLHPRVVLTRGVLKVLSDEEVRAVLAHEAAHLSQRHDLVVLPFVALGQTFPRLRPVRTALASVALLVEMLADDRAARRYAPQLLARALGKVGAGQVPDGALGAAGTPDRPGAVRPSTEAPVPPASETLATDEAGAVRLRTARLLEPPDRLGPVGRTGTLALTALLLALPVLVLLMPAV